VAVKIKLRGDTAANWTSVNPVLVAREVGLELDTKKYKVGDGSSAWDQLDYWGEMTDHNHDDQYYTENEIITLLGGKANTSHNHTTINVSDFDAITQNGHYDGYNATGAPTSGTWYYVIHTNHSQQTTYASQIAHHFFSDRVYYRRKDNNIWRPWKLIEIGTSQIGFCKMYGAGNLGLSVAGWTTINFNGGSGNKTIKQGGYEAFSTNNTTITMLEAGLYRIRGTCYYHNSSASNSNNRQLALIVGGVTQAEDRPIYFNWPLPNGGRTEMETESTVELSQSANVYMQIYTDVGGTAILDQTTLKVERLWSTQSIGI